MLIIFVPSSTHYLQFCGYCCARCFMCSNDGLVGSWQRSSESHHCQDREFGVSKAVIYWQGNSQVLWSFARPAGLPCVTLEAQYTYKCYVWKTF